jgi:hypothetical protein
MRELVVFTVLFGIAVLIHLAWLRMAPPRPRRAIATLLMLFSVVLSAALLIHSFSRNDGSLGFWSLLHVIEAYVGISLVYIISYLGLLEDSPSVTMVRFVDIAGARGRARDEFDEVIGAGELIRSRMEAMEAGGLIRVEGGRCLITEKGRRFEGRFGVWQRFLRLEMGG